MSKYYDYEGQVEFAKQQFDKAREYKEKNAKKYNDVAKKLLGLDTLISAGNYFINNAAQELDANMGPQKAQLQHIYNKSQDILNTQKLIDTDYNGNATAYWTDFYKQTLESYAVDTYAEKNITSGGKAAIFRQAEILGKQKALAWTSVLKEAKDIPTNVEDLQNRWSQFSQSQVPHTVADWATRGLKNFFKGETKESIEAKSKEYRENLLSNKLFKDFGELDRQYQQFQKINPDTTDEIFTSLVDKYNEIQNKVPFFRDKLIGQPQVIKVPAKDGEGNTYNKNKLLMMVKDETSPAGIRPVTIDTEIVTDFKEKKPEERKPYSATEIDVALSSGVTVMDMVKDKNYKTTFNAIYGDEKKRRALGQQILETADNILAKEGLFKSLSKSEAEQIATVYITSQAAGRGIADKDTQLKDASPLTTNITEFEIFMIGAELSPESPNFNLEQLLAFIPNFIEDDRKTNNGLNNPENLTEIYTTALEQIHKSDLSIDLKNEYIRNLNEEFNMDKNMGIVTDETGNQTNQDELLSSFKTMPNIPNITNQYKEKDLIKTHKGRKLTYLTNWEETVDELDLSNLSIDNLGYLATMSNEELYNYLGLDKDISLTPFRVQKGLKLLKDKAREAIKEKYISEGDSSFKASGRTKGLFFGQNDFRQLKDDEAINLFFENLKTNLLKI
jgi:hypothetical protein